MRQITKTEVTVPVTHQSTLEEDLWKKVTEWQIFWQYAKQEKQHVNCNVLLYRKIA